MMITQLSGWLHGYKVFQRLNYRLLFQITGVISKERNLLCDSIVGKSDIISFSMLLMCVMHT